MADIYIGNVKGPTGATGATGAQGPQGDAATIAVGTVSTTAYGNTAQVTNTGTSSEAVFDFVIPQGRPGEETTQMSALTLDTVTAQSAEYPIPATGESGAVVFGKIIKFFNDIKTAVNSKINISDIVNNLTSTATNKPLSAAQGKALNDALGNKIATQSTEKAISTMVFDPLNGGLAMYVGAKSAWYSAPINRSATVSMLGGTLNIVTHGNILVMGIAYGNAVTPVVNTWTTFAQLPSGIGAFNPITLSLVNGKSISIRNSGGNLQYNYSGSGQIYLQGGGVTTISYFE